MNALAKNIVKTGTKKPVQKPAKPKRGSLEAIELALTEAEKSGFQFAGR